MQNWNDRIREQLNNLPGFPPAPTGQPPGTPMTQEEWILGDWIEECLLRPAVASFALLPLTGNALGDVRASIADEAWYIWDGTAWQQMTGGGGGAVNSVSASAPLSSSGGANPNISLSGIVPAANGGTGLSVPGAAGNVLTSTGTGWVSSPSPATGVTNVTASAPLASSGGTTPNVSLTGIVPVANGGTGTSTAFTPGSVVFAGASGVYAQDNANLFFDDVNNRFGVGVAGAALTHTFNVGAGVAAFCVASGGRIHTYDGSAPLNGQVLIGDTALGNFAKATLTAGSGISITNGAGAITIASTASSVVDIPATAQEALNAGDFVRFVNDAGAPKVQKADATNTDNRLNGIGFALAAASANAAVTVRVAGVVDVPAARFDAAPAVTNVGQRVFVSTTAGQITLTAPSTAGLIVQRTGILVDGSGSPKVLVQIGDPVLLS